MKILLLLLAFAGLAVAAPVERFYLGSQAFITQGTSTATAYASGVAAGTKGGTTMTWAQILAAMQQKFSVPAK